MVEHVNVPPQKEAAQEAPQLSSEQMALQLLATELHRPPQSLAAFSHLTAECFGKFDSFIDSDFCRNFRFVDK